MLTTGSGTIGGNASTAYSVVAVAICIIAPAFLCFTIFGARERREAAPAVKSGGVKKVFRTIAANDQLRWIALIFLIQQVGNGIAVGGLGSTYIYFEYGYDGGLYSLFTTVGMSATAFLMIFYPVISRKVNRKPLMKIMAVISLVGFALMLLSKVIPALGFVLVTAGYMLSNFGLYCYYLVMMISIINTVEYNEYTTGQRDEAIIASVRPFVTKMASAVIVLITTGSYILSGVVRITNNISDLESAAAMGAITEAEKLQSIQSVISGVSENQKLVLLLCMTILPCILMLLSNFLYQKKYKLDEAEYARICKELEA